MTQGINTERMESVITKLETVNNSLTDRINATQKVESRVIWESRAGTHSGTVFYRALALNQARSEVLQNYIDILRKQVDPNYIQAEEANKLLAAQFE